jgi:hypothetical protein
MDFSENVSKKAEILIAKAKLLPGIDVRWQSPIAITCSNIDRFEKGVDENVVQALFLEKFTPAVYYFELLDISINDSIIKALKSFKDKRERSCPKIDMRRSQSSTCLYCGSVKTNLHGRLIQHLGKSHKSTYALQLLYWASDLKLELKFHYAWIDSNFGDFTELLESALAEKLNPLVGKLA